MKKPVQVIIYIPSSHVLYHEADMLSVQLLHDSGPQVHKSYLLYVQEVVTRPKILNQTSLPIEFM